MVITEVVRLVPSLLPLCIESKIYSSMKKSFQLNSAEYLHCTTIEGNLQTVLECYMQPIVFLIHAITAKYNSEYRGTETLLLKFNVHEIGSSIFS